MMFYPDKDKGFRETHRVLTPGGRHVFSVADTGRYNTYLPIVNDAVCRYFTSDPPTRMLAPLSYSQVDPIKDSLLAAGFTDIRLTVLTQHRQVADFANFARGFVFGTPILHDIRERATRPPEAIVEEVAAALRQTFGPEPTTIPIQALVFEARRE